jgi:hypothetical protein
MLVKTLQKTHMSDTLYLQNVFRRIKCSLDEYNTFCSEIYDTPIGEYVDIVWDTMAVDLLPYLFTVDYLNFKEFKCFIIFYYQYAKDAGIDTTIIAHFLTNQKTCNNIMDVFVSIIQTDVASLVAVLILMQYFFL